MMLATLLGAVAMTVLPVQVESATCPSGQEVEQALAPMLPSVSETNRPDVARVLRQDNRLQIELVSPDAVVIAERQLDNKGTCAELAELIAVVIASWESDVHPEFTRPHAAPMPAAPPETAPPPPPSPAAFYEVAAGAALSWAGSPALAGILSMGWVPRGAGPGLRLSATVESTRTLDLGAGLAATWRRYTGSVEFDWRVPRNAWALDFHGGLAFGELAASGTGFSQNHSDYSFSPGGTIGLHFSRRIMRHASLWLDLAATYWPRKQMLYGQPNAPQQEIQHFQGLASIGLAFGQFPSER
jgi:hypothetical protein